MGGKKEIFSIRRGTKQLIPHNCSSSRNDQHGITSNKSRQVGRVVVHQSHQPHALVLSVAPADADKNRKDTALLQAALNLQLRFHLPYKVYLHLYGKQRTGKRHYM
ncbi:hypothetical protein DV515_00009470 [Chloebia gouldiae]|uniref:Uncharacterized protein n=1 Tax=Chloebia gouldiae TaxID=44316 RepID=A0A3L8SCK6_CHLGU|nr:hypothetical protein DV515_00009470 [Chloebia gouldiae]